MIKSNEGMMLCVGLGLSDIDSVIMLGCVSIMCIYWRVSGMGHCMLG